MAAISDFIKKAADWVGPDGFQHFCVSAIIVFVLNAFLPLWVAILAAITIGAGKEALDAVRVVRVVRAGQQLSTIRRDILHDLACDAVGITFSALFCLLYVAING